MATPGPFKYTFMYNVVAGNPSRPNDRFGGFADSYFRDADIGFDHTFVTNLYNFRSSTLSNQCTLVGIRIADTGNKNISRIRKYGIQGTWSGPDPSGDFPSAAIFASGVGTVGGQGHRLLLRGLPDVASVGGTISGSYSLDNICGPFFQALRDGHWAQKQINLTAAAVSLRSISGLGVATSKTPHTFAVNDFVTLLRQRDSNGNPIGGGTFLVDQVTDNLHFRLASWTITTGTKGGSVRKVVDPILNQYADLKVSDVTTRKVGKAFFQYRGRQKTARPRLA